MVLNVTSQTSVVIALAILNIQGSWGQTTTLEITQLSVPPLVRKGKDAKLNCIYNNQNISIASIKWFLNETQFLRYMPYEDPPLESFPVTGKIGEPIVNIDVSRTNGSEVYLINLDSSASGEYRCMVTEDGPYFRHVTKEANLTVTAGSHALENKILYIISPILLLGYKRN